MMVLGTVHIKWIQEFHPIGPRVGTNLLLEPRSCPSSPHPPPEGRRILQPTESRSILELGCDRRFRGPQTPAQLLTSPRLTRWVGTELED